MVEYPVITTWDIWEIPVEHDRSSMSLSIHFPPTLSSDIHDRKDGLRKSIGTAPHTIPRLGGKLEKCEYGMFEAFEKSRTHHFVSGEVISWGARNLEGIEQLRGCERRKAPLHLNRVSFY